MEYQNENLRNEVAMLRAQSQRPPIQHQHIQVIGGQGGGFGYGYGDNVPVGHSNLGEFGTINKNQGLRHEGECCGNQGVHRSFGRGATVGIAQGGMVGGAHGGHGGNVVSGTIRGRGGYGSGGVCGGYGRYHGGGNQGAYPERSSPDGYYHTRGHTGQGFDGGEARGGPDLRGYYRTSNSRE